MSKRSHRSRKGATPKAKPSSGKGKVPPELQAMMDKAVKAYMLQALGIRTGGLESIDLYTTVVDGRMHEVREYFDEHNVTIDVLRQNNNEILTEVCTIGKLDKARFLFNDVGMTIEDFRCKDNAAFVGTCSLGGTPNGLRMVRFLMNEVGLTAEDARAQDNQALVNAAQSCQMDVVRYLLDRVHVLDTLPETHRRATLQRALRMVTTKAHLVGPERRQQMIDYLKDRLATM